MTRSQLSDDIAVKVSGFAGSWKFVGAFMGGAGAWMLVNSFAHFDGQDIYLNLMISIATTLLATFILMRENRHRQHDIEVRREHMEMTRQIKILLERETHG